MCEISVMVINFAGDLTGCFDDSLSLLSLPLYSFLQRDYIHIIYR